ncbi:MAG: hypothetical protein HYV42_03160 [Candidatus Magasanikbacteria bacterium]|nr:hypothetical protein [Candidatus Magasanikbacteria bacterium]
MRRLSGVFVLILLIGGVVPVGLPAARAFDERTTHPALTEQMAEFFNLNYPQEPLTPKEKALLVQGSIDEDTEPRWINHFYDPIYNEGWRGERMGILPSWLVRALSRILLSPEEAVTSKQWSQDRARQTRYALVKGDRTWQRALEEAAVKKNPREAYYTLGFILHLLEDAVVPDHTRGDTHAHPLASVTGDYGSPYEEYAKRMFNSASISGLAKSFFQSGIRPVKLSELNDNFDILARYSNQYFFSKDTIESKKYLLPAIVKEDSQFGYGRDQDKSIFPLVRVSYLRTASHKLIKQYTLTQDQANYPILNAYFVRHSRAALAYGAGVIKFFRDEVRRLVQAGAALPPAPRGMPLALSPLILHSAIENGGTQPAPTYFIPATGTISTPPLNADNPHLPGVTNPPLLPALSLLSPLPPSERGAFSLPEERTAFPEGGSGQGNFSPGTPALGAAVAPGVPANEEQVLRQAIAGVSQALIDGAAAGAAAPVAAGLLLATTLGALGYVLRPQATGDGASGWDIVRLVPRTIYTTVTRTVERLVPVVRTVVEEVRQVVYRTVWQLREVVVRAVGLVRRIIIRVPVREAVTVIRQVTRQVVELVKRSVVEVYQTAQTIYQEIKVGEVRVSLPSPAPAVTTPVAAPIAPAAPPPNLYRWVDSVWGPRYGMVVGGVWHDVAGWENSRLDQIFGDTISTVSRGAYSAGWSAAHGGGTVAGGAKSLDALWSMQTGVMHGGLAPTPELYARGFTSRFPKGSREQQAEIAAFNRGVADYHYFEPALMYNPADGTVYTVNSALAAEFSARLDFRRLSNDTPRDQVSLAVYDTPEDFLAGQPNANHVPLFPEAPPPPTLFEVYFKEERAKGRSPEDILRHNPFMGTASQPGALYTPLLASAPEGSLAAWAQAALPWRAGLSEAQQRSITHLLETRANEGRPLNNTDAKNLAFALGRPPDWPQFAGVAVAVALSRALPRPELSFTPASAKPSR